MTAKYLTKNKQLTFEIEGTTDTELFSELASIQEVFDAEHKCGVCGGTDIRYLHRNVQGNDFFELQCITVDAKGYKCLARFQFGQVKVPKGALFPKRKDKDGNWLPNNGWSRYSASGTATGTPDPWEG